MPCGCADSSPQLKTLVVWWSFRKLCMWLWCWATGCKTSRLWMASLCKTQQQLLWGHLNTIVWTLVCWGQETNFGLKVFQRRSWAACSRDFLCAPRVITSFRFLLCPLVAGGCHKLCGVSQVPVGMAQSWAWEPFCVTLGKNGLGWLFVNKEHEQSNDLLSIFPTSDPQQWKSVSHFIGKHTVFCIYLYCSPAIYY